jgi:hypothetical protein
MTRARRALARRTIAREGYMKKRDTIADIEQSIETTHQAFISIGGVEPGSMRFMAIYSTLIAYADERAGTTLLSLLIDEGITPAGIGLLSAVLGKPQLRTVKAMFQQWQFGTDPARREDMRILLRGIIPERGIELTYPDGRVETLTRGAFLREPGA